MAFHAVAAITGEFHVIKIVVGVNGEVGQQIFSRMNLMDHGFEMDRLTRQLIGGSILGIGGGGVVAKLAILNIQALAAVLRQSAVATVAIFSGYHRATSFRGTVSHRKRENLIEASVAHLDFAVRPRLQLNEPVALNGDGITALSISWNRLLERIRQHAVLAGRVQSALPPIGGVVGIWP